MSRSLIALAILLATLLSAGMAPADVSAEPGCAAGANMPSRSQDTGLVYGNSNFACPNDPGARQIQSCIIVGGTWWDCDTAYPTGSSGSVTAECHYYLGNTVPAVTWYWFYGEDGRAFSGYGPDTYQRPCDYGVD